MAGLHIYPRFITFQTPDKKENELKIYQEVETDVGGVVWDSALLTIHYFFKNPHLWKDKRILELGSGTGVCGIALSALGADVIVTDLPERIPLLDKNLEANRHLTSDRIKSQVLDWSKDSEPENIDTILAVDCIYYHSTIDPLISLFRKSKAAGILIVTEERDIGEASAAQKSFFEKIGEFFTMNAISKHDLDPDYYAEDIIIAKLERK